MADEEQAVQIAPLMHVAPGPSTVNVRIAELPLGKAVLLHIEHTTGTTVIVMPPDFARSVAKLLNDNAAQADGGLVLPSADEVARLHVVQEHRKGNGQ